MKIHHKPRYVDRTDPEWAERVEREAEVTTAQAAARWQKAHIRLERAISAALVHASSLDEATTRRARERWEIVERRRDELRSIEALAQRSPAGSQNRGAGSFRGQPRSDSGRV